MKRANRIPNFRGWHAWVLHRPSAAIDPLTRQLERLGMTVDRYWPDLPDQNDASANLSVKPVDILFFDADMGMDEQFPWPGDAAPMPTVALIGSEAPGRLEWVLSRQSGAHLQKPVSSAGVFSSAVLAVHAFEQQQKLRAEISELRRRLKLRPVVARVLMTVMRSHNIDEHGALRAIRAEAMKKQQTIEDYCAAIVASGRGGPGDATTIVTN
ncbi:ANTAR domain-containing response regulator [Thalassospira alkalitolerans]|uniref:ANTAR domain-containing response regulator n=1 Tax=Thalassospira alkalitolerans TaxID=1293890 RepID=UPI003AA802AD